MDMLNFIAGPVPDNNSLDLLIVHILLFATDKCVVLYFPQLSTGIIRDYSNQEPLLEVGNGYSKSLSSAMISHIGSSFQAVQVDSAGDIIVPPIIDGQ